MALLRLRGRFSPRSLPRTFQYLEWIYIAAHFGMWSNHLGDRLPTVFVVYGIFLVLGWVYPVDRPQWQRLLYVTLGLGIVVWTKHAGIELDLFLFFYLAKGYFLFHQNVSILITVLTGVVWVNSEYLVEIELLETGTHSLPSRLPTMIEPQESIKLFALNLLSYAACSFFLLMFSSMVIAEQKGRQQIEALSEQVETLAATIERTRIAREIHDSLGHTLTDLDIQLAVAQALRSRNLEQSFHAVDTAKVLSGRCIEEVSQALNQMRQSSDFNLNQAIAALLEQMRYNAALQIESKVDLPQLPIHKSYQIYCILKEALINIQKHAHASQISFCGQLIEEGILLDLKDNGVGFDPEKLHTGFGIQGMIERVQLLGGRFELKAAPMQGTQIQILLPL